MKIGIIVAMDKELVQLKSLLDDSTVERRNNKDFILGRIGDKTTPRWSAATTRISSSDASATRT